MIALPRASWLLPVLLVASRSLVAQEPTTGVITRAAPCAVADSSLGPKVANSKADLTAAYIASSDQGLLFTQLRGPISNAAGIRGATALVRLPGRDRVRAPSVEITLRIFSDSPRQAGSQWLRLAADDSVIGDSLPLALRRQAAIDTRRVLQTATAPLTAAQTLALAKASRISGALSGTRFDLTDEERDGLRAVVTAAMCGTRKTW